MLQDDVQLIRRTLSGDESAFGTLVQRHQKGVHALIWRKIGDFHYAEELTQDTFLQAYKKLGTLKDPNHFSGWLYVIANRLSINWLRRNKPTMQSLEATPVQEIEESSYKHYMFNERETGAAEQRSETVKNLLKKLPESERTVVTLYYLSEMTVKEIGNFLGVSVNTIKSRLRRGRERLQAAESLVHEVLGRVQLPADLTERIMREVADMNPIVPPAGKPLFPWAALGAATVLVLLMLGASYQYLARFQQPYSFEARSEPTVEIVEAPIVIDILSKVDVRRQLGQSAAPGKSIGAGTQISEVTLRSNAQEDRLKFSTAQWRQSAAPPGGHVGDIFAAPEGTVYAVSSTGMYRLAVEATAWTRINASVPTTKSLMPMVENQGVLYIVSADEIFASTDNGQTWNVFCPRPKGFSIGLIVTDTGQKQRPQAGITMYLALRDAGIFRSTDGGTQWESLKNGLIDERISAVAAIGKTVFAGTNRGLYRLDSDFWKRLPVGTSETIYSMTVYKKNLYVGTGPDLFGLRPADAKSIGQRRESSYSRIFRSSDLGVSWTEITPKSKSKSQSVKLPSGITVLAAGEALLALGITQFHSTDGGETWTNLGIDAYSLLLNSIPAAAVDERTFYKVGAFGIHRTTDGGKSWHLFMKGVMGTRTNDLIAFNNRLYAHTGDEVFQSTNAGVSWQKVPIHAEGDTPGSAEQEFSRINTNFGSKLVVSGNTLYCVSPIRNILRISRLSTDHNRLISVQDVPAFANETLSAEFSSYPFVTYAKTQTLAVSRNVFYVEYKRKLFKWRLGDPEWTNTGLVDTGEQIDEKPHNGFKIAASGETIYVGKRDGKLFQSLDGGRNWRDVTPTIPLQRDRFFRANRLCRDRRRRISFRNRRTLARANRYRRCASRDKQTHF
ncbi:sigma-70 family RNA polymerase sigma factor [Candidatus Poribacteria bacterium]|nr:sigma-70 family RNA polymerase sigma factor [Candidatus Poribacteria bacterium]MYK94033.1 sigma-70 family RNA polymerase sigma factor [Candidatus Poribacteria bacterium]